MLFRKAQPKVKAAKKLDTGRKAPRALVNRKAESRRGHRQFNQIRHSQSS